MPAADTPVYLLPLTTGERRLVERAVRLLVNAELVAGGHDQRLADNVLAMLEQPLPAEELRALVDVLDTSA